MTIGGVSVVRSVALSACRGCPADGPFSLAKVDAPVECFESLAWADYANL